MPGSFRSFRVKDKVREGVIKKGGFQGEQRTGDEGSLGAGWKCLDFTLRAVEKP